MRTREPGQANDAPELAFRRRALLKHVLHMTQRELATLLGCSQPMISGLLRGTERSRRLEEQFALRAGVPWSEIFREPSTQYWARSA